MKFKQGGKKVNLQFETGFIDEDTVEFAEKVLLHPCERSRQKLKKEQLNLLKKIPLYP